VLASTERKFLANWPISRKTPQAGRA